MQNFVNVVSFKRIPHELNFQIGQWSQVLSHVTIIYLINSIYITQTLLIYTMNIVSIFINQRIDECIKQNSYLKVIIKYFKPFRLFS